MWKQRQYQQRKNIVSPLKPKTKSVWVRKSYLRCNVVLTALTAKDSHVWYLDNGCSRHMTGNKSLFTSLESCDGGSVKFGDGSKSNIVGKGTVSIPGMSTLSNVFLVNGLKANLLSISQLCDSHHEVHFSLHDCVIVDKKGNTVLHGVRTTNNCYVVATKSNMTCHTATSSDIDLWHQRLGHVNHTDLDNLAKNEIILGIPKHLKAPNTVCGPCQIGKQIRSSHKKVDASTTTRPLELLHMDLMGPTKSESIGGKKYIFMTVDDFSQLTWVRFLKEKSETFDVFLDLWSLLINEKGKVFGSVVRIHSDHGSKFQNSSFNSFCSKYGIKHEFSTPRTPQQNAVVERKNRVVQEMARVMLHSKKIPHHFWAEAINTTVHTINRVYLRPRTKMTPYEIWSGRKPTVKYFITFGSKCYILKDREHLSKFDSKSDEGIFLDYSMTSKAYRVFNFRNSFVMESVNVVVDDARISENFFDDEDDLIIPPVSHQVVDPSKSKQTDTTFGSHDSIPAESKDKNDEPEIRSSDLMVPNIIKQFEEQSGSKSSRPVPKVMKSHPISQVLGDAMEPLKTRQHVRNEVSNFFYMSSIEPKNIKEALLDDCWINVMHEELEQFERNYVWDLVPRPNHINVIGTKWIYKNKTDELGQVIRNKARLVAQGYTQIEGIDFDETFAPVARQESIRLLLAIACFLHIKLYQMDVKSAFLNEYLNEEVFVEQPKGFQDPHYPNHVFKLKKALYGLKQAPRAWYERLKVFLLDNGFKRGSVDKTLFIKEDSHHILISQIYVDDIVFGSTSSKLVDQFSKSMSTEFEMSMVGELIYFLGLQIKQCDNGIFVSQSKYAQKLLEKFGMKTAKHSRTPMSQSVKLSIDLNGKDVNETLYRSMIGSLLYLTASRPDIAYSVGVYARYQSKPKETHIHSVKRIMKYVSGTVDFGIWLSKDTNTTLVGYSDADWAGCADDRKSTTGGCFFIGSNLVAWHNKKQTSTSLSTTEAEYIFAGSCCTQLLWMKQMLADYGIDQDTMTVYCDNHSAIDISRNPVQHSRTKHIDIRHHFIRELVEEKIIVLDKVSTEHQLADIFTKPLEPNRFESLRKSLGISSFL